MINLMINLIKEDKQICKYKYTAGDYDLGIYSRKFINYMNMDTYVDYDRSSTFVYDKHIGERFIERIKIIINLKSFIMTIHDPNNYYYEIIITSTGIKVKSVKF
jgi:hypothetical protein